MWAQWKISVEVGDVVVEVEDVLVREEEERSWKDEGGKFELLPRLFVYSKDQESRSFQEWRLH